MDGLGRRRGPAKLHVELRGDGARRRVLSRLPHEVTGRCPVAVTVEQGPDDAAVEHSRKCLVMRLGAPLGHEAPALLPTLQAQSLVVGRTAAETAISGCVSILHALHYRILGRPGPDPAT